ncbi:MAG TPA: type II toxin-antitoxin system VapC family toxin [Alphaproteobacteria bacterium]|jgi:ribonuclease VapC|nr:type II toxin-antitoxin system VapC family toxin [Alphaproteobacteria bacterium]
MVIDSSAVVAIFLNEPDARLLERRIADDPVRLISAGTLVETGILIESKMGAIGGRELDLWLQRAKVEIVPVDEEQVEFARRGWRRFGKGRHPAGLNYGDCFSYALAVTRDEPLLFKGNDFLKTDVKVCT